MSAAHAAVDAVASDARADAVRVGRIALRGQALRKRIGERNHQLFENRRVVFEFERFFLAAHREARGRSG